MNILLLGSGGRESALAWKLRRSRRCSALYIAPGNGGTGAYGQNVALNPLDFEAVGRFVLDNRIDMVVVGPEDPLVGGIHDYFQSDDRLRHIPLIGPSKAGAQLEGSKAWAKQFMLRHGIPTAAYRAFTAEAVEQGLEYLKTHPLPIVLKADGLAAGKGVVICDDREAAAAGFRDMLGGKFGAAGAKVVVEQFLQGIEFSVFVLTDGTHYRILPEAKDYKRIGEGDTGPNTGGMGAVSPVPFVDAALWQKVETQIIRPTVAGLAAEKIDYKGFIFFGLIRVGDNPYVIEYNCRMGDPETEAVIPRLRNDLVSLLLHCHRGTLNRTVIRIDPRAAATVMLVSGGYPDDYEKGKVLDGVEKVRGSLLFQAGTRQVDGRLHTNGGRVLAITSYGDTLPEALQRSYRNAAKIHFEGMYYRKDIGRDVL
ncbi:MAG: phosphoribosylamine--glycine ligase [Saprospiraceae bacterium]|nr:phosphoribosylamine--glycine ligase [Saprospiraceae bacterium]